MNVSLNTIEQVRTTAIDLALKFGPKLFAALVILAIGFLVAQWLATWLDRALYQIEMEPHGFKRNEANAVTLAHFFKRQRTLMSRASP